MKKYLLPLFILALAFCVLLHSAHAAIAHDTDASGRASGGSVSFNITVGSLSNGIMVCGISIQDSNHANMKVLNLTYNSVPLTFARRDEAAGNNMTEIYYLINPASGTHSVSATAPTGIGEFAVGCSTFSGVDQDQPMDAVNGATGNSTTPSVSLTTVADNAWSFTVVSAEGAISAINNSQTLAYGPLTDQSFENSEGGYRGPITPAGATTLSYTTGSASWAESAMSFQPAGTAETIQIDTVCRGGQAASASSITFSCTVGSGSNRVLVVSAGGRDATQANLTIDSVTWNGTSLTNIRSDVWNASTFARSELWYIKAPASGTFNIIVTWHGSSAFVVANATAFTGVDQTNPIDANGGTGTTSSTNASISASVTTVAANDMLITSSWLKDGSIISNGTNQINQSWDYITSPDDTIFMQTKRTTTAGSYSITYTTVNADGYAVGIAALTPASAAAPTEANGSNQTIIGKSQIIIGNSKIIIH